MNRPDFLHGVIAAAASMVSPSPAQPMNGHPGQWDECSADTILPFDKPLAMTMDLLDAGEKRFDLLDYRGQALIVNIFASWCGPCNREQPAIVRFSKTYEPRGLAIVGINVWDSDNRARAYRDKYAIDFPIAMDRKGVFTATLEDAGRQIRGGVPMSFFIRPDGYLYCIVRHAMTDDEWEYRIKKFLAEAPPTVGTKTPAPERERAKWTQGGRSLWEIDY